MYKKIAVEDGLTNVAHALHTAGFQTSSLDGQTLSNVQAIVLKGNSGDGEMRSQLRVPIINASGRSADEIVDIVRDRLS